MSAKKRQPKRAKKQQKPGPDAERLKIEGDPIAAFDRLVKHKPKPEDEGED